MFVFSGTAWIVGHVRIFSYSVVYSPRNNLCFMSSMDKAKNKREIRSIPTNAALFSNESIEHDIAFTVLVTLNTSHIIQRVD